MNKKLMTTTFLAIFLTSCTTVQVTQPKTEDQFAKLKVYNEKGLAAGFVNLVTLPIIPISLISNQLNFDLGSRLTGEKCVGKACTTITVCIKNHCQKIKNMILDTKVSGIHIFESSLNADMKNELSKKSYVYNSDTVQNCFSEGKTGSGQGYVVPVKVSSGTFTTKTNINIVQKFGKKTYCKNKYLGGIFEHPDNFEPESGDEVSGLYGLEEKTLDFGFDNDRSEGISGIFGLSTNTKDEIFYAGGDFVYNYDLIQPTFYNKSFTVYIPKSGEEGELTVKNKCNFNTKGAKFKRFDTEDTRKFGTDKEIDEKNRILKQNGRLDLLTKKTKGLGELYGKTLNVCNKNGTSYVKIDEKVYEEGR